MCKMSLNATKIEVSSTGSLQGGDLVLMAANISVHGTVSTSGQGYAESSGDGKGSRPEYSSYSSSFRVSGSGAGHGGNGANGCYRYSSWQLPTGGGSYGSSSDPRTFGSGGGRGRYYYGSCTSQYGAGGRGGGRIYMNASTIEIASGATVSADGTQGATYSSYAGGGGGSGGSILMETCNMSGGGIVRASGGASVLGSGAGGGGRISIRALIDVSAELTVIASGGASSSPYTCAGAAGTVYAVHDTSSRLIFDNNDNSVATTTLTPFPPDLSGVHLSQIMILRKTYVGLRQAETNNDVRASSLKLDASSKVTGDTVIIDVRDATIEGSIAGTSEVWLHNSQSGAGLLTAHSGSSMTCSGCALRMSLSGSNVSLHGSITTATVEVKSLQSISHTGTLTVSGVALTIAVDAASIAGTVECTGAACSILVSANATLQLRGSLSCTNGKCSVSLHSGGDLNSTASMSCAGNSQCLVDIASGSSALLGGSIAGSDIRMLVAGSLQIQGLVSTSGQGYAESSGDGKGS
ncbi:MAG: hypothetical protein ACPIOQ_05240, partial [Promethearchaeia archaeon]